MAKTMKRSAELGNRSRPDLMDLEEALVSVKMPMQRIEVTATNQLHLKQIKREPPFDSQSNQSSEKGELSAAARLPIPQKSQSTP